MNRTITYGDTNSSLLIYNIAKIWHQSEPFTIGLKAKNLKSKGEAEPPTVIDCDDKGTFHLYKQQL